MAAPHHVETGFRQAILTMIEAREGLVELLAEIVGEAGPETFDETVLAAPPFAEDVDGLVELCYPDLRQKTRLELFSNEALASFGDGGLFLVAERPRPHPFRALPRHPRS